MEKVAGYIGRSHECELMAACADDRERKKEYLKLADLWLDLAIARQEMLTDAGVNKPH
jgi:hypothetical protein